MFFKLELENKYMKYNTSIIKKNKKNKSDLNKIMDRNI